MKKRGLKKGGNDEHLEGTYENKIMLIRFIHSALQVASFIHLVREIPNTDPCLEEVEEQQVGTERRRSVSRAPTPERSPSSAAQVPATSDGSHTAADDGSKEKKVAGAAAASGDGGKVVRKEGSKGSATRDGSQKGCR